MGLPDSLMIVPGNAGISLMVWLVLATTMLYLARKPAHIAIHSFSQVMYRAFRMAARSVSLAEQRLQRRNRDVLLTAGQEEAERQIEREFFRIDAVVERDLSSYPALHRNMQEELAAVEEKFRASTDTFPTMLPGWDKAIDSVAKIPVKGTNMVADVLDNIHRSFVNSHKESLEEYRRSSRERHSILSRVMPHLRRLTHSMEQVNKNMHDLQERSAKIDQQMQRYEQIRAESSQIERVLSSSSLTQFFISGLVLLIAAGGAIINFNLISYPMQEMVGGGSYIGPYRTADVAALVIIMVEVSMGLYLMELLRITRLFPVIGAIDDKMRKRMMWVAFSILFILASVESALAYMRDVIAADDHALKLSLTDGVEMVAEQSWIPLVGQMTMGFILPWALVFVAIPLESFVHSARTVAGIPVVWMLRMIAFVLRLVGSTFRHLGPMLERTYDVLIFAPLFFEQLLGNRIRQGKSDKVGVAL